MKRRAFKARHRIPFRMALAIMLIFTALALTATSPGCGKGPEGEEAATGESSEGLSRVSLQYPPALSSESSPMDVARVLIKALDEGDKQTLLGWVAAKAEVEAVEAIYRRHGRTADTNPEQAARLAAGGWLATYAFFQKGQTEVKRESIRGDKVIVFASGKAPDGKPRTLIIKFAREDGLWKVRAGLQSLSE